MLQETESALPGAAAGTEGREKKMELPRGSFFFNGYFGQWHLKENNGAGRKGRGPRLMLIGFPTGHLSPNGG